MNNTVKLYISYYQGENASIIEVRRNPRIETQPSAVYEVVGSDPSPILKLISGTDEYRRRVRAWFNKIEFRRVINGRIGHNVVA